MKTTMIIAWTLVIAFFEGTTLPIISFPLIAIFKPWAEMGGKGENGETLTEALSLKTPQKEHF